jgi:hypothetical protein
MFSRVAKGNALEVHYEINGHPYNKRYHLADGIYPTWSTFVKRIRNPEEENYRRFAKEQEDCGKDVERAFCEPV